VKEVAARAGEVAEILAAAATLVAAVNPAAET
jgi:hypothetical protein